MPNLISCLICIYIIVLPIIPSNFKLWKIPINGDALLGIIIFMYLVKIIICSRSRKKFLEGIKDFFTDYFGIFAAAWIIIMFISISYSLLWKDAVKESCRFLSYVILYFIIKYDSERNQNFAQYIGSYIIMAFVVGVIGIFQHFMGIGVSQSIGTFTFTKVSSTLENSNNLGAFFIIAIFPFLMITINQKNIVKKVIYGLLTLISLFNIFISTSRNAYLAFLIGGMFLILIYNYRYIIGFVGVAVIMFLVPSIRMRMMEMTDESQNVTRIKIWDIAIKLIKQHPLRGVGSGNYSVWFQNYARDYYYLTAYDPQKVHPHNAFLKAQCELGVIGTISFTGIIVSSILKVRSVIKKIDGMFYNAFYKGFLASLVAFIFMNVIDNYFSAPKVIAYFWILTACADGLLYKKRKQRTFY